MDPIGGRRRLCGMPTAELVSLIIALIIWIMLLSGPAPDG
jgi:hypothetical protein